MLKLMNELPALTVLIPRCALIDKYDIPLCILSYSIDILGQDGHQTKVGWASLFSFCLFVCLIANSTYRRLLCIST